jgi:iron-sulfur cluster assembly accessory protein
MPNPIHGTEHGLTNALAALNYRSEAVAIRRIRFEMSNVTVTERAARQIGAILRGEPPGTMLRVSVEGGGCSGFQYRFEIDRSRTDDDVAVTRDGAVVLIDQVSYGYLAGSEIDFVDDLIGASFRVNNPQATASCGCGTSFSL